MATLKIRLQPGEVTVDDARVEEFIRNPDGPVVRDLVRRGNNVEAAMRVPVATGLLASTKRTQVDLSGRMPAVDVIVGREGQTDYLGYLINGTRPHEIRPKTAKALRFISGGQVVFARSVRHPGTRPSDFMERALEAARD